MRLGLEIAALGGVALVGAVAALGRGADRFAGIGLWANLLPFAAVAVGFGLALAGALRAWLGARTWLAAQAAVAPMLAAVGLACGAIWWATQPPFQRDLLRLRATVGGTAEAERLAIAHQVFAAYRRADRRALARLLERARAYEPIVHEAAAAFGIDPEVLMGVGATESSFLPRTSADGGRGLFQITAPPAEAVAAVRRRLGVATPDPEEPRQNAWLAAATLERYLADMRGDLFLGLLAYNIGPRNGGLRSIMAQYGARDFVTIQPYLQLLPRDYPVRVLAAALAYRLSRVERELPAYEAGDNAIRIQRLGVPGL
ncbi:MAG: transglycosylase SLT domain-containing protein [Myxococcales bacterium]|jgi:soluble lytic murein transglycosylase-like protein|nr:transglycosylase SLT domain-containing protein [Myxococcales bacterium]